MLYHICFNKNTIGTLLTSGFIHETWIHGDKFYPSSFYEFLCPGDDAYYRLGENQLPKLIDQIDLSDLVHDFASLIDYAESLRSKLKERNLLVQRQLSTGLKIMRNNVFIFSHINIS